MTDGSSMMLWDLHDEPGHVGSSWRTCPACTALTKAKPSDKSPMRLPKAASMRNGHLYERPPLEPATSVSAGSASLPLLKTPTANLEHNGGSQHPKGRARPPSASTLQDEVEHLLT